MTPWILALYVVTTGNFISEWPHRFATHEECMETGNILASQWHAPPLKAEARCKEG